MVRPLQAAIRSAQDISSLFCAVSPETVIKKLLIETGGRLFDPANPTHLPEAVNGRFRFRFCGFRGYER